MALLILTTLGLFSFLLALFLSKHWKIKNTTFTFPAQRQDPPRWLVLIATIALVGWLLWGFLI